MFFTAKKAVIFCVIAAIALFIFLPGLVRMIELREKNRALEAKIKNLNIENALLAQELNRVENDPLYQERLAREKMGVVRKGEIPVKIVPDKKR